MALDPTIYNQIRSPDEVQKNLAQTDYLRTQDAQDRQQMAYKAQMQPMSMQEAQMKMAQQKTKALIHALTSSFDQDSLNQNIVMLENNGIQVPQTHKDWNYVSQQKPVLLMQAMDAADQLKMPYEIEKIKSEISKNNAMSNQRNGIQSIVDKNTGGIRQVAAQQSTPFQKSMAKTDANTISDLRKNTDKANELIYNLDSFIGNMEQTGGTGPIMGSLPSFSASAKAADSASGTLQLNFSNMTKGAISDKEMALFKSLRPELSNTKEANRQIAASMKAVANRVAQKAAFFEDWGLTYGDLTGASAAWTKFINENPIFDTSKDILQQKPREDFDYSAYLQKDNNQSAKLNVSQKKIFTLTQLKEQAKKMGVPVEQLVKHVQSKGDIVK